MLIFKSGFLGFFGVNYLCLFLTQFSVSNFEHMLGEIFELKICMQNLVDSIVFRPTLFT